MRKALQVCSAVSSKPLSCGSRDALATLVRERREMRSEVLGVSRSLCFLWVMKEVTQDHGL